MLTLFPAAYEVVVAEWLRRLTRNQMGYARTGSNPVHDVKVFFKLCFYLLDCKIHVLKTTCAQMQSYHINMISFSK